MSSQYGELRPLAVEIGLPVWGTPANFNGFRTEFSCTMSSQNNFIRLTSVSKSTFNSLWRLSRLGSVTVRQSTSERRKRCKIGSKLVLITNRKSYMSFRLVAKSVTLNDLERRNGPYFALFHRIFLYDVAKQLLGLPRFQNLLLIVFDHIKTISAIIQRLFGQNKLITRFDGCSCIDNYWFCAYIKPT